jgi:hypothetical protein
VADLRKLMSRAERGDATALPELREFFKNPDLVELTGNLASHAEKSLVRVCYGDNLLAKEGLTRKLDSLRADLAGANPTPLERLLVERVVAGWLQLSHLEATYYGKESMPLDLAMHYQRCLTLAEKRYLVAIKMLAQVRKVLGLAFDVPRAVDGTVASGTFLPLVCRAANAPVNGELPGG